MDSLAEFRSHPLWDASAWVLVAIVALGLRQLAHRSRLANHLDASLSLIAFGVFVGGFAVLTRLAGWGGLTPYFDALVLGCLALGGVRVVLTLFVDFYLRERRGAAVSAIIRDVASIVAYFIVVVVVLRTTLDINLASVVATSAVLTAIVGLALQDQLGNLFSGLVLEIDAPFVPGDWVRLGDYEGIVEETNWRTTKLRTRVNEIVVLPNAMLSKQAIVNYTRPSPLYGDTLRFDVAYEAPPNVVREVVEQVFSSDPAVESSPAIEVRLQQFGDSGVHYAVRYWISEFGELERIRNRLHTNLWYGLRRAGLRQPFPARDVFVYQGEKSEGATPEVELLGRLRGVPLLAVLDEAALLQLAGKVRRWTFGRGEVVVREGDPGDSFYVIESGSGEVLIGQQGRLEQLGTLGPGSFFGEMSLLAGEPRTATVRASSDLAVLVIGRDAFKEIIGANPALLEPISELAARRHADQEVHRHAHGSQQAEVDVQRVKGLSERIRQFLRL